MRVNVKVKPNSPSQKIEKISENEYIVFLKKPPEKNKANIELMKLLRKHFGTEVKLLKGKTSKNKIIEVKND